MENIKRIYESVVSLGTYSFSRANRHNHEMFELEVSARDLPNIELKFLQENHIGCSLHYSMALLKLLRDIGVNAYICITLEKTPFASQNTYGHVSVYYVFNGEQFIADPIISVQTGNNNFFAIPFYDFLKENLKLWIYDPYGIHGSEPFFDGFLSQPANFY